MNKERLKEGNIKAQVRFRNFMRKLEAKMTPGWELLLTIFFGWTGIRWWIKGNIGLGLRMFLTLGVFGIGWIIEICNCLLQYINYLDIEEKAKKGILKFYTVIDEKYGGSLGDNNCVFFCNGLRWLGDIDTVQMHNNTKFYNEMQTGYPIVVTTDECYRLKLYVLKDRLVATNVEGVEFEYRYDMIRSLDIYNDVLNIEGKDNYIYTVRMEVGDGYKVKMALLNIMSYNKYNEEKKGDYCGRTIES